MAEQDWRSYVTDYGAQALLAVVVAFMFWVRTLDADSVIQDTVVYFTSGNDPWYHARVAHLVVEYFPATPHFDPFSYFPYGTGRHSGFGGLFDQLIALASLIVGLGSPSGRTIDLVVAFAPAAFGAATAVPVYLVTKRIYDRWTGLTAAIFLALFSGSFLTRTAIGTADHQSAEAFFATFAILGFLIAVTTGYREKPMLADVQDRNWIVLRRPLVASLLGGIAIGAYLITWGPGVMLVFTMGVFVVLQSFRDHLRGRPPEYLLFGTVVSLSTAGVITLAYAKTFELKATAFSLLQPLVLFGIAAGALVLYALSSFLTREDYEEWYFPPVVLGLILLVFVVATIVFPQTGSLLDSLLNRVYSFGLMKSATALTVGELAPGDFQTLWRSYGPILFLALGGLVLVMARALRADRPGELLVILWTLSMVSAYFTALRFGYYLAVNAAILGAVTFVWLLRFVLELDTLDTIEDVEAYQVMGVIIVLLLVIPGNVVAFGGMNTAWQVGEVASGSNTDWQNELQWMRDGTPEAGMDYDQLYEEPDDGDYDYPASAYGVMSWWDYGHWITHTARRIPNANPFQQGQNPASAYFQFQNETRANLLLEALPSIQSVNGSYYDLTENELQSIVDGQSQEEANEDTRYVMIDDQMAGSKFSPIATWTGPGFESYVSTDEYTVPEQNQSLQLPAMNSQYDDIMMSKLYYDDADDLAHYRLVHEANSYSIVGRTIQNDRIVGGVREVPLGQGWQQAQQYERQIQAASQNNQLIPIQGGYVYDAKMESAVKTYERVPGAQLSGEIDDDWINGTNTSVTAVVRLQTNTGRNFTYTRRTIVEQSGEFSLTVPYATDDTVTPAEGGTDSGVEAVGNYTVYVGGNVVRFQGQVVPIGAQAQGSTALPESAVLDGDSVEVDFEEIEQNQSTGNETNAGNTSNAPNGSANGTESGDGNTSSRILPRVGVSQNAMSPSGGDYLGSRIGLDEATRASIAR